MGKRFGNYFLGKFHVSNIKECIRNCFRNHFRLQKVQPECNRCFFSDFGSSVVGILQIHWRVLFWIAAVAKGQLGRFKSCPSPCPHRTPQITLRNIFSENTFSGYMAPYQATGVAYNIMEAENLAKVTFSMRTSSKKVVIS